MTNKSVAQRKTARDRRFEQFALTHWVERRRGALVLLNPNGEEVGMVGLDPDKSEMAQHAALLSWGFKFA